MREIMNVNELRLTECATVKVVLPETVESWPAVIKNGMFQKVPFGKAMDKNIVLREMESGVSKVFLPERLDEGVTVEECVAFPEETVVTLKRILPPLVLIGSIRKGRWHEKGGDRVFNLVEKMQQGAQVYVYSLVEEVVEQAKKLQSYKRIIPLLAISSQEYEFAKIKMNRGVMILEGMLIDLYAEMGKDFLLQKLPLEINELAEAVEVVCQRMYNV